jgi:hypothetical protein
VSWLFVGAVVYSGPDNSSFFEWTGERVWDFVVGAVFLTSLLSVLIFFLIPFQKTTPR